MAELNKHQEAKAHLHKVKIKVSKAKAVDSNKDSVARDKDNRENGAHKVAGTRTPATSNKVNKASKAKVADSKVVDKVEWVAVSAILPAVPRAEAAKTKVVAWAPAKEGTIYKSPD